MSVRETYRCFFPVFILLLLLNSGNSAFGQQSLLIQEINLSHTTAEISDFLREISRKGDFSFTYTSEIQVHRMASVLAKRQTVGKHLEDIFRFDSIQIKEQNGKILLIPRQQKKQVTFDLRNIKGLVIDEKTRRPLPYSNVFLVNRSLGTITNTRGRFELKVSSTDVDDTLGISFIGYKQQAIPLEIIDTSLLVVRLATQKIQLKEVIIKPLDPIYILTKAIEQFTTNYDRKPALFTGFYRESTTQDRKNISLSEAVVNVYKEPYSSLRDDQVRIYKGRNGSKTDEKEFVDFIVQGSLYNTLQLDIVKNPPTFLDPDYFPLYDYTLERMITHYERPTYVIFFDQREGVKYPCYRGRVYIDARSLAVVGASFELNEKGMSYTSGVYVRKSPTRVGVKPINALYEVYYRYYNGSWNISNARSEINIRIRRKRDKQQDKFNSVFSSISEFVITGKDTLNVSRFKTDEIARPRDVFAEQIGETDQEFWGDENIIIPDEPIEKTILKLGRRNDIFTQQEIEAIRIEEEKESGSLPVSEDAENLEVGSEKDDE